MISRPTGRGIQSDENDRSSSLAWSLCTQDLPGAQADNIGLGGDDPQPVKVDRQKMVADVSDHPLVTGLDRDR